MDFITLMIEIMIFITIIPIVSTAISSGTLNLTGGALALMGLVTLVLVAALIYRIMKKGKVGTKR